MIFISKNNFALFIKNTRHLACQILFNQSSIFHKTLYITRNVCSNNWSRDEGLYFIESPQSSLISNNANVSHLWKAYLRIQSLTWRGKQHNEEESNIMTWRGKQHNEASCVFGLSWYRLLILCYAKSIWYQKQWFYKNIVLFHSLIYFKSQNHS